MPFTPVLGRQNTFEFQGQPGLYDKIMSQKKKKRETYGARELAERLGVLAALTEDTGLISSTKVRVTTICNSKPVGLGIFF